MKQYLKDNPEVAESIEAEIRANAYKLMSSQARPPPGPQAGRWMCPPRTLRTRISKIAPPRHKDGRWLISLEDGSLLRVGEAEMLDFSLHAGLELDDAAADRCWRRPGRAGSGKRPWPCSPPGPCPAGS